MHRINSSQAVVITKGTLFTGVHNSFSVTGFNTLLLLTFAVIHKYQPGVHKVPVLVCLYVHVHHVCKDYVMHHYQGSI